MSGIVGHTMYAMLALKEAERRRLRLARVARQYLGSYTAGAYIGSDVQTMPEAICIDTGREVGYGTAPLEKSPITGGPLRPFKLKTPAGELTPREVFDRFYGRAHLLFGFSVREKSLHVPLDHLPDYFAAVIDDVFDLHGANERTLAYVLGWIVHVMGDSLIKGVQPGIDLRLVDGRYTARNRPVQDLVTFHEVGIKELQLDWPTLFTELSNAPVETAQLRYMRCTQPTGRLATLFNDGWKPESESTLNAVLVENRRWVRHHAEDVLADMQLTKGECKAALSTLAGMDYATMVETAANAGFRQTLTKIGNMTADMFEATLQRCPRLRDV